MNERDTPQTPIESMRKKEHDPIFTFQTRLTVTDSQSIALSETAEKFSQSQRTLFANIASGDDPLIVKKEFMAQMGVDSRQYNAIRIELQGKVDSVVTLRTGYVQDIEHNIASLNKLIKKLSVDPHKPKKPTAKINKPKATTKIVVTESLEKRKKRLNKLHQKKRRLHRLEAKLAKLKADIKEERVHICFGSKKLFNAQFDLYANGYESHEEWLVDWQNTRNSQFFVVGSKDETAGCSACQAIDDL
jgi:hypothetical protein